MEVLGLNQSQVRRLIEDNVLAATRVDGVLKVPADFIHDGEPLPALQGTIVLLRDVGFDGDELVQWLITEEESLTVSPVDALKAGRKAEVRRIAQALL
nr:Rv2175c family DNA-binding protein [uncultured Aurantimicrobium sp.]